MPTWNYVAVHAYGTLELVEDEAGKEALLNGLMRRMSRHLPNGGAGCRRVSGAPMLAGIVGFRIPIARIEGKFKVSQNRAAADREKIAAAHAAGNFDQQALAGWMARLGE